MSELKPCEVIHADKDLAAEYLGWPNWNVAEANGDPAARRLASFLALHRIASTRPEPSEVEAATISQDHARLLSFARRVARKAPAGRPGENDVQRMARFVREMRRDARNLLDTLTTKTEAADAPQA